MNEITKRNPKEKVCSKCGKRVLSYVETYTTHIIICLDCTNKRNVRERK